MKKRTTCLKSVNVFFFLNVGERKLKIVWVSRLTYLKIKSMIHYQIFATLYTVLMSRNLIVYIMFI